MSEFVETFDMSQFVDRYAERMNRHIDAAVLKRVEADLARFGYVKVVRCRDCVSCYQHDADWLCSELEIGVGNVDDGEPEGFCAWSERKEDDE